VLRGSLGGYALQRRQDQHRSAQGIVTFWPLLICTLCYIATSAGFAMEKNWPMSAIFLGYSGANLGFLWIAWR
jgi:hypothetical protein